LEGGGVKLIDRRQLSLMVVWATLIAVADLAQALEVRKYGIDVAGGSDSIFWKDDNTLVFIGLQEVNRREPAQYYGKRVGKLVVLDISTGQTRWLDEFRGLLCVDGERIAYYTSNKLTRPASDPDDRFGITRGSIGNLVTQEVIREDTRSFDFRYSCRPDSELPPHACLDGGS
jgi:hypothetical protein